jgi:lipoprotein-anchoring transpeptidase ErfK/SrfK
MLPFLRKGERRTTMRRLVAIHIKSGVAVGLWALGALCVAAEVRQPGFWSDKVNALHRSGDRFIVRSGDLRLNPGGNPGDQKKTEVSQPQIQESPEPAVQNNEVAAEQQASQIEASPSPRKDPHTRLIVISIPDRQLALLEDGELVKVYPVAVGARHSPSPEGEYTVINHAVNPTYRHKDQEIAPGKDNPLGSRWMGLSLKGYGIHGTNVQNSVGKAASHGCFRMKKKDVEDLYTRVQVGDAVSVRGQRDELTAQLFTKPAPAGSVSSDTQAIVAAASKTETEVASATTQPAVAGTGQ